MRADSGLDKGFEAEERSIPMVRDAIEISLHGVERAGIEREAVLAPGADAAHKAGALEHAQMLGDGLAREL